MANIINELDELYFEAKRNPTLKQALLATRSSSDPYSEFCRLATQSGHPITVGELFAMGQEDSDKQCKSTNGGNPSPYDTFDEPYENFINSLE